LQDLLVRLLICPDELARTGKDEAAARCGAGFAAFGFAQLLLGEFALGRFGAGDEGFELVQSGGSWPKVRRW
jgi:hypothetical protein